VPAADSLTFDVDAEAPMPTADIPVISKMTLDELPGLRPVYGSAADSGVAQATRNPEAAMLDLGLRAVRDRAGVRLESYREPI
jgi:hypothetical protein